MRYVVIREPSAVREVLGRPEDFAPTNALTAVEPLAPAALRVLRAAGFALPPVLASASGEMHARVRRIVAGFVTPARISATMPAVVDITADRVRRANAALADGPVDLVAAVARHAPISMMNELFGTSTPDVETVTRWSLDSLELFWGRPGPERQVELARSAAAFYAWLREEVTAAHGAPGLFGALHAAGLPDRHICSLGYFLLIAGHQTTTLLIATAWHRALQRADMWSRLSDGVSARDFVRHVLATESSVPTWRRMAESDTEVRGRHVPAGTQVLLELTGIEDGPRAHTLAFGYGIHRCLGARLAELEATAIIETTARLLVPVRLVDSEPDWLRLLSFQAPSTVSVERIAR